MAGEEPIRELYPLIRETIDPHVINLIIYPIFAVILAIAVYGIYLRYKSWRAGKQDADVDNIADLLRDLPARLRMLIDYALLQRKVLRDLYGGVMHVLIFVGMIGLIIITGLVFIEADFLVHFNIKILTGNFYLALEILGEFFGLALIVGTGMALYRRAVKKPIKLLNTPEAYIILVLLLVIAIVGFILEGMRLAYAPVEWGAFSFVGYAISKLFIAAGYGAGSEALIAPYTFLWLFHFATAMLGIALVPYTKLFHIVSSPINIFVNDLKPAGELSKPFDAQKLMESDSAEFSAGAKTASDFNWKQRLSFDACTICGRCQEACPAFATDKPLSPRNIVLKLKDNMHAEAREKRIAEAEKTKKNGGEGNSKEATEQGGEEMQQKMATAITADEIWACTTCMACIQECPVLIQPMSMIVDLRRYLVMKESKFPDELQATFRNLETNYNPWAFSYASRADWMEGEGVTAPIMQNDPEKEYDVLLWIGCAGAFDDRIKKVSAAVVRLLTKAGVNFGVLGTEEQCCGETARRIGNEFMAQVLIQANVNTLKKYKFKKLVTMCPHGYNTFKNEYPKFGGNYEVMHHSEVIASLIREGKLTIDGGDEKALAVVYHDSCYLGRYNGIFDQPRDVLSASGYAVLEMKKKRDKSFCCGAGGGRIWLEETIGKRISHERLEQALATGTKNIATACPYCLTMFEDARKAKDLEDVVAMDIAEYVDKKTESKPKEGE